MCFRDNLETNLLVILARAMYRRQVLRPDSQALLQPGGLTWRLQQPRFRAIELAQVRVPPPFEDSCDPRATGVVLGPCLRGPEPHSEPTTQPDP